MPELPEVETIARGLDERLRGDRILSTWFSGKREPFKTPPQAMAQALPGMRIERVFRVGKHIVFDLEPVSPKRSGTEPAAGALQWIVHLGMTGRLLIADAASAVPAHTHGILSLASGRELRFTDPRRFGRMELHLPASESEPGKARGFAGTGREPLSISVEEFTVLFRGRRTPIKAALLNQKLLHGVGNIYADESLFRAGIRPRRMAARLTRADLANLHEGLARVLREAIALGGSSVSDYVDATGAKGFFQLEHRVYLRTGKPCLVCGTPIRRILVAGRGTHYCPHCQR
ncbi:MAG TPA: bifunctional DNA-formamidopyrimidine glycosylase/DNA-(apurinic or apyrimidinic site) lyase [Acidobacteriaceae bacterium]|nr:bifunctional DNA-formamidopyrimidine glycosylase/DNA-(apurinic or apyrimidinic site) lyase [Acidobacteriaceae bacterium]